MFQCQFFSYSRYPTKCVSKFLFTQLMTTKTLIFIFDHPHKYGNRKYMEIHKFKATTRGGAFFFENQEGLYHQQSDALCSIDLPYGNGTPESTGIKEV